MSKPKSDIDILRDILNELSNEEFGTDQFKQKIEEAHEFLDSIDGQMIDLQDELKNSEEKVKELEQFEKDPEYANETDLGLDTLRWELVNGNMVIDGLMENFIESVQKKYAVIPA